MSMAFITEELLKNEIKRFEETPEELKYKAILYHQYRKELAILQKLSIDVINTKGLAEEFEQKLENQHIYFMEPGEYQQMELKSQRYDLICSVINGGVE